MTNAYYEATWAWLEDNIDIPDILADIIAEYKVDESSFDDLMVHIIWSLWGRYPYGELCDDAVADFVTLLL